MEFGAAVAYKKIDTHVQKTLEEAARVLKKMQIDEVGSKSSVVSMKKSFGGGRVGEVQTSSSYESRRTISIASAHHSSSQQPKATIRTPRDVKKNRSLFFPEASIAAKPVSLLTSTKSEATDTTSGDPVTQTPDTEGSIFFPKALYIPAGKRAAQIKETQVKATQVESVHRLHIQKLGVEPLEDIGQLKCRGLKKLKPNDEFPKATYTAGGRTPILMMSPMTSSIISSSESSSLPSDVSSTLMYQPIDFVSTDGRYRLTLQAKEKGLIKKETKKCEENEEFPIIPKQLQSCTKLKIAEKHRTKFSSKITIGDFLIDVSGIFNGKSMRKRDLSKLVINGQSYSI